MQEPNRKLLIYSDRFIFFQTQLVVIAFSCFFCIGGAFLVSMVKKVGRLGKAERAQRY
jgi:hypothetical protein